MTEKRDKRQNRARARRNPLAEQGGGDERLPLEGGRVEELAPERPDGGELRLERFRHVDEKRRLGQERRGVVDDLLRTVGGAPRPEGPEPRVEGGVRDDPPGPHVVRVAVDRERREDEARAAAADDVDDFELGGAVGTEVPVAEVETVAEERPEEAGRFALIAPGPDQGREVGLWAAELERSSKENGIDYNLITTDTPFDKALFSYLSKRQRMR